MNPPNQTLVLETQREAVARIVDPAAWKYVDDCRGRINADWRAMKLKHSLTKADQIIALILGGLGEEDAVSQSQPGCAEKEPQLQASEPSGLCEDSPHEAAVEPNQLAHVEDGFTRARLRLRPDQILYECVSGEQAGRYVVASPKADGTYSFVVRAKLMQVERTGDGGLAGAQS